jgi:hypothetical protein
MRILYPCISFILGVVLIVGTKCRWKFLVDPPESWAPFYSHSVLKKLAGKEFLVGYNYFLGVLVDIISIILFIFYIRS